MIRLVLLLVLGVGLPAAARGDDLLGEAAAAETAIEEQTRLVLAHGLEQQAGLVAADIAAVERLDEARRAAGRAPCGLADDLRYLAAGLLAARDAQRAALEQLLEADPDPLVRKLAEHRLEADDGAQAAQLLADDRHNRRASVLNDAIRPLGVFSGAAVAAAINPFLLAGSAIDSVATTAVNLWNYNRLSTPEREALARYTTALQREPATVDAPEMVRAVRRLGTKRAEALCTQTLRLADEALDADDLDHAAYYARSASRIEGCGERAEEPLTHVTEARARRAAREEAGQWPVDDPPRSAPGAEAADHEALLAATALGDPGAMTEAANRFLARHEESPLAAGARYALAVARDLAGHATTAREALGEIADDDDTSVGRHAAAVLASPDFDRFAALRAAENAHSRATARWVLLGPGMDGRTAMYGALQLGAQGAQAAQSLGVVNVIGVLTRAWQAWRKDPVSNQAIIERGEELLARQPHSPDAPETRRRLADAYERTGAYGRAIMHLRACPVPDTKRITRLEEKLADTLLAEAEHKGNDPVLLAGITRHFAATEAAETARQRLAAHPGTGETVLAREVLRENPQLLSASALDLDPRLLDGEGANGELAEAGVTLAGGELRLALEGNDTPGPRTETRPLSPEAYSRAQAAAQEVLYARLLTDEQREPESGRLERYVPVYVQGTFDADGVSVYPGVKMRRYRSTDRALYE